MVYYEYDYKRRPTKVTVNGTTTEYAYDDENGITAATFAGHTFTTKKNKDGNVLKTEADGAVQLEYTYANGLLKRLEDKVTGETADYEYNVNKAVSKISSAEITETYNYNDRNEIISKTYGGAISQVYGYTYRNNAARDIEYITMPNGLSSYPLKDVNGRNTGKELRDGNGNKVYGEYITYRKVGDRATNMPSAIWYAHGKEIKDNLKYKYDTCGNITEIKENGKLYARYEYDGLNRIIREDNKKLGKSFFYTYDGCGNITSKKTYGFTLRATELLAELEITEENIYAYEGDRLTSFNGQKIQSDSNNNPEIYKGETLEWEYGKRLKKYGDKTFTYDGFGRRVKKGDIQYYYDSSDRLIKSSDGMEYFYDHTGVAGFKYSGITYYYIKDVQGNITAILDSDGNTVVKYTYDAWGNHTVTGTKATTVGKINPFRYRSYFYDVETKFYYLKTRYYDPATGRFINMDSIAYADPEALNGLNLYAYCGNNPVMNVDPEGTWNWNTFFKVVAWVALGVSLVAATVVTGGLAGAAAAVAVGACAGGLIGGYMNEEAGGSFEAGWIGGAVNGTIQTVGYLTGGYVGTVTGGGIGAGIGTFITESINCAQQNKNFNLQNIVDKSVSAGFSSSITSIFTAGAQFIANSGVNSVVGGSVLDKISGSIFGQGSANIFSSFFGIIDDYLSYKLSPYMF